MKNRTPARHEDIATTAGTKYVCYFSPEPDGGYLVPSPGGPSLSAYGDTVAEARANAREEIQAWEEEAGRLRDHFGAICYNQGL